MRSSGVSLEFVGFVIRQRGLISTALVEGTSFVRNPSILILTSRVALKFGKRSNLAAVVEEVIHTASSNDDDLTSFIHDVSQLSEGDIKVLEQLASPASALNFALGAQESTLPESPFQAVIDDAEREKLLTEDFYSHCFRLVGFGLAAQIPGNSPSLALNSYSFRLTRRGHTLLALLKQRV